MSSVRQGKLLRHAMVETFFKLGFARQLVFPR
jgi:hypothetical protein